MIKFLTIEQIIKLHTIQIEKFGGSSGVKDEGLLYSAVSQPETSFDGNYFHKDLYEMASAYLFHLVKNHAFHDGNKRIAALASAVFLQINGLKVIARESDFEQIVMKASQSLISKEKIADFFRTNTES